VRGPEAPAGQRAGGYGRDGGIEKPLPNHATPEEGIGDQFTIFILTRERRVGI